MKAPTRTALTAGGAAPAPRRLFVRGLAGCLLLAFGSGVLTVAVTPPPLSVLGGLLAFAAGSVGLLWILVWLWQLFTWRARRRLFASFVFVGVAPLVMALALTGIVEGFYWVFNTASLVGLALDDVGAEVGFLADLMEAEAARSGVGDGVVEPTTLLPALPRYPGLQVRVLPREGGEDPWRPGQAPPSWMEEPADGAYIRQAPGTGRHVLQWVSLRRLPDGRRLVALLELDAGVAAAVAARTGIQVASTTVFVPHDADPWSLDVHVNDDDDGSDTPSEVEIDTGRISVKMSKEDFGEIQRAHDAFREGTPYGWLVAYPVASWSDEEPGTGLLLFFSTLGTDFARLKRTYGGFPGKIVSFAIASVLSVFGVTYLALLLVGVVIAASVSGGVGRLYEATRQFAQGNFDYRMKVRRRDQMGELAHSMNDMAASIETLMRESSERERLSEEFRLAQDVQRRLLPPPLPPMRGVEVAGTLRPMTEVGGDTYDWRAISDHELLAMVADVSGHGLRPGLLAAMAKACLVTKLPHAKSHPELLGALHHITRETADPRLFMTVGLATFDLETMKVTLSSAGHPPCLRLRGTEVRELGGSSYPLGVREERTFQSLVLDLAPGDVYLLVSDGLVEGRNVAGEPWGYERLGASLRKRAAGTATGSATSTLVAVLQDFDAHVGSAPQDDDVTLLVITIPLTAHGAA